MRTYSALLSVALAAGLAGCGSAPTKPAFAPGYTPTEAEMGLAELNTAAALHSEPAGELKAEGGFPNYADTRLLYLAALHQQATLKPDEHTHVEIGKLLDQANLAAGAQAGQPVHGLPELVGLDVQRIDGLEQVAHDTFGDGAHTGIAGRDLYRVDVVEQLLLGKFSHGCLRERDGSMECVVRGGLQAIADGCCASGVTWIFM